MQMQFLLPECHPSLKMIQNYLQILQVHKCFAAFVACIIDTVHLLGITFIRYMQMFCNYESVRCSCLFCLPTRLYRLQFFVLLRGFFPPSFSVRMLTQKSSFRPDRLRQRRSCGLIQTTTKFLRLLNLSLNDPQVPAKGCRPSNAKRSSCLSIVLGLYCMGETPV